jgi:poly(hydroxyalkanoate) depolymerase family esterase
MNLNFRSALGHAMHRLKAADVAEATAVIQRAIAGQSATVRQDDAHERDEPRLKSGLPRRLGDVLQALRVNRPPYRSEAPGPGKINPVKDDPRFTSRSFRNTAGSCSYKLYVPADYAERALALVVMLHGCTQDPDDFARGTRMNALADEFGLIVAYPQQQRSANAQGCWNWFDARHQRRGSGEPAVLAGLALQLAAEFTIERDRVFAAGLSAGGAMADVLSSTYPEVFAAVGVHSGLPHGAANNVMTAFGAMKGNGQPAVSKRQSRTRKIVFHGTADATVHSSNGEMVFASARSDQEALQELTSCFLVNGRQVTRTHLLPGKGTAIAEHWVIEGGGHAWSGGDCSGSFTDATGPDASREMIRFFLDY